MTHNEPVPHGTGSLLFKILFKPGLNKVPQMLNALMMTNSVWFGTFGA
jgi:hypothetical protein